MESICLFGGREKAENTHRWEDLTAQLHSKNNATADWESEVHSYYTTHEEWDVHTDYRMGTNAKVPLDFCLREDQHNSALLCHVS